MTREGRTYNRRVIRHLDDLLVDSRTPFPLVEKSLGGRNLRQLLIGGLLCAMFVFGSLPETVLFVLLTPFVFETTVLGGLCTLRGLFDASCFLLGEALLFFEASFDLDVDGGRELGPVPARPLDPRLRRPLGELFDGGGDAQLRLLIADGAQGLAIGELFENTWLVGLCRPRATYDERRQVLRPLFDHVERGVGGRRSLEDHEQSGEAAVDEQGRRGRGGRTRRHR